jgi:hypothetical protein
MTANDRQAYAVSTAGSEVTGVGDDRSDVPTQGPPGAALRPDALSDGAGRNLGDRGADADDIARRTGDRTGHPHCSTANGQHSGVVESRCRLAGTDTGQRSSHRAGADIGISVAAAELPMRGVGIGTGVNAAACPLTARTASAVRTIPLLAMRFISTLLSPRPCGRGHRCFMPIRPAPANGSQHRCGPTSQRLALSLLRPGDLRARLAVARVAEQPRPPTHTSLLRWTKSDGMLRASPSTLGLREQCNDLLDPRRRLGPRPPAGSGCRRRTCRPRATSR